MTIYLPTLFVMAVTGVILLGWDIEVVWKPGDETISRTALTLWLSHPVILSALWVLLGHLAWPKCGSPDQSSIGPLGGTVLGVVAIVAIIALVWDTARRVTDPPALTPGHFARLAVLAITGFLIGHFAFGQYVPCTGGA